MSFDSYLYVKKNLQEELQVPIQGWFAQKDQFEMGPKFIKSPSFPIMINYPIKNFEVLHYDLYRLKDKSEITNLDLFENNKDSIINCCSFML